MTNDETSRPLEPGCLASIASPVLALLLGGFLALLVCACLGLVQQEGLPPAVFWVSIPIACILWVTAIALHLPVRRRYVAVKTAERQRQEKEEARQRAEKERWAKMTTKERAQEIALKFSAEIAEVQESPLSNEDKRHLISTLETRRDTKIKEIYQQEFGPSFFERLRQRSDSSEPMTAEEIKEDLVAVFERFSEIMSAGKRALRVASSGNPDETLAELEQLHLRMDKTKVERAKIASQHEKVRTPPLPKTFDDEASDLRAERDKRLGRVSSDDPEATQERLRRDIEEWFEVEFNKLQKKYRE